MAEASEIQAAPTRASQRDRILARLQSRFEVPAAELAQISLQYNARVLELRAEGWVIDSRIEMRGRSKHGFFRLVAAPGQTVQREMAF